MDDKGLREIFSRNRAEELGYDLWNHFVVPPFFEKLNIASVRKPNIFVGGRGCGKTMLLRYLCHETTFSKRRSTIPENAFSHVGLYWRVDTQFASLMKKRNIENDIWQSSFGHLAALQLGMELLESIRSITKHTCTGIDCKDLGNLDFSLVKAFDPSLPTTFESLLENLEIKLWQFETWLNNVRSEDKPNFLPGKSFVEGLIKIIKKELPELKGANFFIYLDEYENLLEDQKRIINSWLKHSEKPLIFNLAMKRNAFTTRQTLGNESLSLDHDFRQHDLEHYLFGDNNFEVFAAEILLLQLSNLKSFKSPINVEKLLIPKYLKERRNTIYQDKVINSIQVVYPDLSNKELAEIVFRSNPLKNKLKQKINKALKFRSCELDVSDFLIREVPEASIITPALLYRKSQKPEEILEELEKLKSGMDNKFTGKTDWIHNNFVGSLLQLYEPLSRTCPFYAGFKTFCHLSKGNVRHFLELCHKSMIRASLKSISIGDPIPPEEQAEAARQASASFLGEIKTFGHQGNKLHTFVLRLGSVFQIAHSRRTLSEPEPTHFTISGGNQRLKNNDQNFLNEAAKWSVLFEEKETKQKSSIKLENIEYVLNPIYAPYFHISYRKKRKLKLTSDEILTIMNGSFKEFKFLIKNLSKGWSVKTDSSTPSLFSQISDQ